MKEMLVEDIEKFVAPLREKRKEFAKDIPKALEILKTGSAKAKVIASKRCKKYEKK